MGPIHLGNPTTSVRRLVPGQPRATEPCGRGLLGARCGSRRVHQSAGHRTSHRKVAAYVRFKPRRTYLPRFDSEDVPDVDVAAAGGCKDTESLKTAYQQTDEATILHVVLEASELREAK